MTARLARPSTRRRAAIVVAGTLLTVLVAASGAAAEVTDLPGADGDAAGAIDVADPGAIDVADPVVGTRVTIDPPTSEHHVGEDATVTVTITEVHESGASVPAEGVAPGVWLDGRGSVTDDACGAGTAGDGTCTVTVTSTSAGTGTVSVSTDDQLAGPTNAIVHWIDHAPDAPEGSGDLDAPEESGGLDAPEESDDDAAPTPPVDDDEVTVEIGDALVIERTEVLGTDEENDEDADAGSASGSGDDATTEDDEADAEHTPASATEVLAASRDGASSAQLPATGLDPLPLTVLGAALALAGVATLRRSPRSSARST